jgi:glycosyltransferase involved in cell wall biosynthesis
MRIALNMLFVAPGLAGGRVYCEGLLRGLAAVDHDNEYVVYTRRDTLLPPLDPKRFRQEFSPGPPGSQLWRTAWEYARLPRAVRRGGFDLFHGLGGICPSARPCPLVLTIHDLIYRRFPVSVPLGARLFMRTVQPAVARRADRVIFPSRHAADDAVELLGVKEERVRVIPEGPGNDLRPVADEATIETVLAKHGARRPYVISVGRSYPHKNLAGLLRAFAKVRATGHDVRLVLVGDRFGAAGDLDRLTGELGLRDVVVFTGFVGTDELSALYSGAEAFGFASLAEGFGLPVLEAMACGTPVVASGATSLPEVVGDAGLIADARDPEAFAAALARVLGDAALRAEYRRRGLARAAGFTWEAAARATLEVYRELA